MATLKVPIISLKRIEKSVYCHGCGVPVLRLATFQHARTPWNVGPHGAKSDEEILEELSEWAAAWQLDPEWCRDCRPNWGREPVRAEIVLWASEKREDKLIERTVDIPLSGLTAAIKEIADAAVQAGADPKSWSYFAVATMPDISTTTQWRLSPRPDRGFNARRVVGSISVSQEGA